MPRKGENIYKRKDGRWEGRYIKERINGKAKYGYVFAHSYKEVKEQLSKAKSNATVSSVSIVTSSNIAICSFSDIAQEWIELNRSQWKSSSLTKYINILNNYLLPRFGQCNMLDISREEVASYISELLVKGGNCGTGLAPKTVNSIISVMKNTFEYASVNKNLMLIVFIVSRSYTKAAVQDATLPPHFYSSDSLFFFPKLWNNHKTNLFVTPKNHFQTATIPKIQKKAEIPSKVPLMDAPINSFNISVIINCHLTFL